MHDRQVWLLQDQWISNTLEASHAFTMVITRAFPFESPLGRLGSRPLHSVQDGSELPLRMPGLAQLRSAVLDERGEQPPRVRPCHKLKAQLPKLEWTATAPRLASL